MRSSLHLAERGHDVNLFEKSDKLGGQWAVLSSFLPEEGRLIAYQAHRLKKFGVKVKMETAVTAQMVRDLRPDAVVVATGSKSATP